MTTTTAPITARPFRDRADIERVRQFLFATYNMTQSGLNWEVRRWEGKHFHSSDAEMNGPDRERWQREIRLWETADGELVGVTHPEDGGDVWLEVHPDHRDLEDAMYAWAETVLPKAKDDGSRELYALSLAGDDFRESVLRARSYEQTEWWAVNRWREMAEPVPPVTVAGGYTVRSIRRGNMDDLQRLADVIAKGFGRDSLPVEILVNFERAPSYNADLILVAEAADGAFVAHAGVTYNPETRLGIFEPVCTHPDHRRRGLARACMVEGLHRLQALGALRATVGTGGTNTSNFLYEQIGFTQVERVNIWRKTWAPQA